LKLVACFCACACKGYIFKIIKVQIHKILYWNSQNRVFMPTFLGSLEFQSFPWKWQKDVNCLVARVLVSLLKALHSYLCGRDLLLFIIIAFHWNYLWVMISHFIWTANFSGIKCIKWQFVKLKFDFSHFFVRFGSSS